MKIALVHDWLTQLGGAERVLKELHAMFPQAPIYTLFYDKKFVDEHFPGADIRPSWLQKVPRIIKNRSLFACLMPVAIEMFDLSDFDTVISSSVFFSKGLVLRPKTKHICYCYSPTRPLWDRNTTYERSGWLSRMSRHVLRLWDRHAAERPDVMVAISKTVRDRIKKYYNRDVAIIYPPAVLDCLPQALPSELADMDYYLIVSRLFPYKNTAIAVDAFNKLGYNLAVIGDGPERRYLESLAGPNVQFLGWQSDAMVAACYQTCRALIMPQEEDFGLTPLEAMSFGKPVLALRKGGATETILEGVTGEFFDDPIPEALADGIKRLNENYNGYDAQTIRQHAAKFSRERFHAEISALVYT